MKNIFYTALRNSRKQKKFDYDFFSKLFCKKFPNLNNGEMRKELTILLEEMKESNLIKYTSNKKNWNKIASPMVPNQITLIVETTKKEIEKPKVVLAKIERIVSDKKCQNSEKEWLYKASNWILNNNSDLIVPHRERSLEIFKDEKLIDKLMKSKSSGVLAQSKYDVLTLEDLHCRYIPPPITWSGDIIKNNGKPIVIIENSNTYYSFVEWNKITNTYSAIVYGNGSQLSSQYMSIEELRTSANTKTLYYFGDIDEEGIAIPLLLRKEQIREDLTQIKLLDEAYGFIIEKEEKDPELNLLGNKSNKSITDFSDIFLNDSKLDLLDKIIDIINKRKRVPQELMGTKDLLSLN